MAVNHHRPSGGMRPSTKAQGWTRGRAEVAKPTTLDEASPCAEGAGWAETMGDQGANQTQWIGDRLTIPRERREPVGWVLPLPPGSQGL